jgi:hypothetical protein
MNNEMQSVIENILSAHGADVFENMQRANAVLLDLAPGMHRERILVRTLAEADGFRLLREAGDTLPLVINRLIETLCDIYSIEREAAVWVTYVCAGAMGFNAEPGFADTPPVFDSMVQQSKPANRTGSLIAIGREHMVAVAADGTAYAHGYDDHFQTDVSGWRRITQVAAGVAHTVGLRRDGTVPATGLNSYDQTDTSHWRNIASVYAFGHETVGVRLDGTCLSAGRSKFDLAHFENIKHIAKAAIGVYGITDEGKVMHSDVLPLSKANDSLFNPDTETLQELHWLNTLPPVTEIISHGSECVALCVDGRLYKFGKGPGYFSQWRDVVSIADLNDCFAILRSDGSVRVLSFDREKPRIETPADIWRDVTAIYGNYGRLVALTHNRRLKAVYTGKTQTRAFGNFNFLIDWNI